MPTRPPSPDPSGDTPRANAFGGPRAGLDFFQDWLKAAGSALPNMPGTAASSGMGSWAMPTLDPEELDKRIQDLKTVQFWLEQNTRMVAMSIQGLEVQKMTLSALKGMNVSMDSLRDALTARTAATSAPSANPPPPPSSPAPSPLHAAWPSSPFASRAPTPEVSGSDDPPEAPKAAEAEGDATASADPDLINPMRWWNTLTEQFTHLASQTAQTVGTSMNDLLNTTHAPVDGRSGADAKARKASARKTARKAAIKKPAKPVTKG
jgi:hypothetical protein